MPPLVMLPYVAGVSEDIRCVCRKFDSYKGDLEVWMDPPLDVDRGEGHTASEEEQINVATIPIQDLS